MKIVQMTSSHPWNCIRIFMRISRSLAAAGHEVHLVTSHDAGKIPPTLDGVRLHSIPAYPGRLKRLTINAWQVFRKALDLDGDVYHFHDPELIIFGLWLRLMGKAVIYDVHENLPKRLLDRPGIPHKLRPALSSISDKFEQFAVKRFQAVIVTEDQLAERFQARNDNLAVVRNYPLLEMYPGHLVRKPDPCPSRIVVSFGGIVKERAADQIVRAMELLPDNLEVKCVIGGHNVSEALHEQIKRMPGYKRVEFVGLLPFSKMISVLVEASVALVLFSPKMNHLDIRSNRFFESMAAGLPVITSNFPNWREIVEEIGCGLTVDPTDPCAIAEAIRWLLDHPIEAETMGSRGRAAIVEKYNWDRESQKLLAAYKNVEASR